MNEAKRSVQEEKVACNVCLEEVPISEVRSEEATDYVLHFCGLDCYARWKEQDEQKE